MLIKNQIIETTWSTSNYKHYINKGYAFTGMKDKLKVRAEDLPKSSKIEVKVKCDYCGNEIEKIYYNYYKEIQKYSLSSCNKCKGHKISKTFNEKNKGQQIELFRKLCEDRGYIPLSSEEDYHNSHTPLHFICPKHGEQKIYLGNLKQGNGCKLCGRENISNSLKLLPEEVSNIISSINNSILLNPEEYINSHVKNLKVKCGTCGKVYITSLNNYKGINTGKCPKCDNVQSRGENKIENYLMSHNIDFTSEKRFESCKDQYSLPFDFYVPSFNLCIEYDGEHHYFPVFSKESHLKTVKHDRIKNEFCQNNGISLLRIPYWEYNNVETILDNELNKRKIA